ncbi:Uncharacterised protein [Vibrio cholerae]|nr:Uncharacterised protein [Vibrio cholerae]CSC64107.1 Uncharacterised protein [Vibrio cholerae]CSD42163.1 Uncharacterised protein [Vibrio cholerae]
MSVMSLISPILGLSMILPPIRFLSLMLDGRPMPLKTEIE